MARLKLFIEATKSRRGRHVSRALAVHVKSNGEMKLVQDIEEESKGTYSKGKAGYAYIDLKEGELVVWMKFIRNFMNRVKGEIAVYDHKGEEVLRLVYRKLKIRRSRGDPKYWNIVENVLKMLGLERRIRRINLNTGVN